jgi:hypothetical protein
MIVSISSERLIALQDKERRSPSWQWLVEPTKEPYVYLEAYSEDGSEKLYTWRLPSRIARRVKKLRITKYCNSWSKYLIWMVE